jgi:site-specific recombinase XerD
MAGIKKNITTHQGRHSFATTITLNNDVPIETVSALLGHRSIKTTQIYAKVLDKKTDNDMKILKEKLNNRTIN